MRETKITVMIGGVEYTFEMNRKSVVLAETKFGFNLMNFQNQLVSQSLALWKAGLQINHANLSHEFRENLYDMYLDEGNAPMEIVSKLLEVYVAFVAPTQADTQEVE